MEGVTHLIHCILHTGACDGLDASDAGGDAAFADDAYHAYVAGVVDVCAAAKLHGVAVFYHADFIAVFFAEEGHGTHGACIGYRHVAAFVT